MQKVFSAIFKSWFLVSDKEVERIKALAEEVLNPPTHEVRVKYSDGDYEAHFGVIGYGFDGVMFQIVQPEQSVKFVPVQQVKYIQVAKEK